MVAIDRAAAISVPSIRIRRRSIDGFQRTVDIDLNFINSNIVGSRNLDVNRTANSAVSWRNNACRGRRSVGRRCALHRDRARRLAVITGRVISLNNQSVGSQRNTGSIPGISIRRGSDRIAQGITGIIQKEFDMGDTNIIAGGRGNGLDIALVDHHTINGGSGEGNYRLGIVGRRCALHRDRARRLARISVDRVIGLGHNGFGAKRNPG